MVAIANKDVERFVARPDPGRAIILVYGPDSGLVSERVAALIRLFVDDPRDPFTLALLSGDSLAEAPERLVEEVHTVPLFGGRRTIHVKVGARNNIQTAVERLVKTPPGSDCRVLIETGDLKKNAPLRALCEKSQMAATLPCYPDRLEDLGRLIDDETRRAGMTITPSARSLLASLIGGDRRASRSEIEKVILYALGEKHIDVADVMAVVTDATSPVMDSLVDAAFAGATNEVEANFAKVQSSGASPTAIAGALVRQAAALHILSLAVDSGTPIEAVLDHPGVHFTRKKAVGAALRTWTSLRLERLIGHLGGTSLEVRRNSKLPYQIVRRTLLDVARSARSRGRD